MKGSNGEGNGTPLQSSCLENPMDGGAWWAAVHGVARSWTQLSDFIFTFHFHALEEEMATHSSVLAWRIPGTGEPRELLFMGSHRVGHDWSDLAAAAAAAAAYVACFGQYLMRYQVWVPKKVSKTKISYKSMKDNVKNLCCFMQLKFETCLVAQQNHHYPD